MTKQRILTAGGIAVGIIAVLLLSGFSWVLPVVAAVMSLMGTYELLCITRINCSKVWTWTYLILSVLIPLIPIPHYSQLVSILPPISLVGFAVLMKRMEKANIQNPIVILGFVVIVAMFFKAMTELRRLGNGFLYLTMAVLVCVMTDSAAYFFGRRFGKHKMAAKVSPKKTVEGSIGGTFSAIALMLLLGWVIELCGFGTVSFRMLIFWALLATAIAQFGDLSMSVLKRISGVKDFSNLFPGHGGILDRFDSSLFVIPFTVAYVSLRDGFII